MPPQPPRAGSLPRHRLAAHAVRAPLPPPKSRHSPPPSSTPAFSKLFIWTGRRGWGGGEGRPQGRRLTWDRQTLSCLAPARFSRKGCLVRPPPFRPIVIAPKRPRPPPAPPAPPPRAPAQSRAAPAGRRGAAARARTRAGCAAERAESLRKGAAGGTRRGRARQRRRLTLTTPWACGQPKRLPGR
jgi:hypothetical protein